MGKKNWEKPELLEIETEEKRPSNVIRNRKENRRRRETNLTVNDSIQGDSIEIMVERLREGEGEDGIMDRDLVYNDNEAKTVNPVTNIRSDKMELMLEEKIGEYEYQNDKHRKATEDVEKTIKEENEKQNAKEDKSSGGDKTE